MRLSKLHINGFKSFPDRAELGFDHGVTAIVGPNGCGKSNVVDAITWVLGEQSAKSLRGERMEDVIFNGSDARKPTATAEVRLKLTNVAQAATALDTTRGGADDDLLDDGPLVTRDIEIGRRLYRSGESEYLIDGEVRRLRDVHDLLMDSGLGVKAYAVIEQGKIGQILASRPAERRVLIEEAAGVTKYKSRRRTAELKLEAAAQNLTRVDDIVFEVEKQRAALKRQAARARRYKRLREELRKWEQVQFARRYEKLAHEIEGATARLEEARAREVSAAGKVAELEAGLEAVRLGLTGEEARATAAREGAHACEMEIGRHQQQVQFDRMQGEELARQAETVAAEAAALEDRRSPAAEAVMAQRDALARAREALDDAVRRVEASEAEYGRALSAVQGVEGESDSIRATVLAAVTTLAALRQARDNAADVRDRVAADRERLELETRELSAEVARARADCEDAVRALADARVSHEHMQAANAAAAAWLADRKAARGELAEARISRERDLAAREARLRSLEDLEASRATFGDAARLLLSDESAGIRQHGAVADHLVVDRSFERAVDALLGELLQHVLIDRVGDAADALAWLAGRNAGRCGFVVLDGAVLSASADGPLVVPPGARSLADVVRVTGPHARAIANVLAPALIVESFDAAAALARTVPVPVASIAGDVFRHGWLVQGGSRQDIRGILETRAEIAALRDETGASRERVDAMTAQLAGLDEQMQAAETASSVASTELHEHEKALVARDARASRTADELTRVSNRLAVIETDRARAEEEQSATERRRDEASRAIEAHQARQQEAEANLGGVLSRLQTTRESSEATMRLVTESHTGQAMLGERVAALENEVTRLEEAGRELEARILSHNASIQRTAQRRTELAASILATERLLDDTVVRLDGLKVEIRTFDERVADLRAQFGRQDQEIRAARHGLDAVRLAVTESEVAKATAAADLTHLSTACLDTTGVPLHDVMAIVARLEEAGELTAPASRVASVGDADDDDEADPLAAAPASDAGPGGAEMGPDQVMALLRTKIERLGPVNMMAIEQFDDLETRHAFLTTQRKDLLDSIAQTGEAIRKIDKTTRERFNEAFESINRHFEGTFTTLFGGGRAGLVLLDQENDQDSGIDIIAQPPGKRLQNVQLLSGGEKALTAMALMFAIFTYRPSPFCLLDEIDAPLDDANIGRFVDMLQGMQEHTQFILITHNRKTMEIANRLYGVTMEEPGVSKLISVQLN